MSLDAILPTDSLCEKLKNLRQYMPNEDEVLYDFGKFLADYLSSNYFSDIIYRPTINPGSFYAAAQIAWFELQRPSNNTPNGNFNSLLQEKNYSSLATANVQERILLREKIPDIANAVCPEEFARTVETIFQCINDEYPC